MSKRTVDLIIDSATNFYNELKQDSNGRYRSWEYCYKVFHDARKAKDVDADWDSYVDSLNKAGLETLLNIYQTAYDRMNSK